MLAISLRGTSVEQSFSGSGSDGCCDSEVGAGSLVLRESEGSIRDKSIDLATDFGGDGSPIGSSGLLQCVVADAFDDTNGRHRPAACLPIADVLVAFVLTWCLSTCGVACSAPRRL